MKDILNRVVNTLEKVEVSGRDNMWNMFVCINQLKKAADGDENIDIQKAVEVLNQIPVSGLDNISRLCGSIDALNEALAKDNEET